MAAMTGGSRRRRGGDDRGAELIELAVVLPILLLVFAAIVDFGFLFQRYEVVTNAAREAARLGALPGYKECDVQDRVKDYLRASGLDPTAATISVAYPVQPVGTSGKTIPVINVLVQYPSQFAVLGPIAGMVGGSGWSSLNLRAASMMRRESAGGSVAC